MQGERTREGKEHIELLDCLELFYGFARKLLLGIQQRYGSRRRFGSDRITVKLVLDLKDEERARVCADQQLVAICMQAFNL